MWEFANFVSVCVCASDVAAILAIAPTTALVDAIDDAIIVATVVDIVVVVALCCCCCCCCSWC